MSSTVRPRSLTYAVWPPITFALPGMTLAVVMPPATPWRKPGSAGKMESIARTRLWTGAVPSLPSAFAATRGRE